MCLARPCLAVCEDGSVESLDTLVDQGQNCVLKESLLFDGLAANIVEAVVSKLLLVHTWLSALLDLDEFLIKDFNYVLMT